MSSIVEPPAWRTLAELERLWRRVSSRPLFMPPNFFKYLRLRARLRLKLLDPMRVRVLTPAAMQNDCESCRDNCCIGERSTVLLRLRDIAMLMDLGREDLIVQDKPKLAPDLAGVSLALRRQVASEAWQIFPVLAQNRFFACRALDDDGRCTLYPHLPLTCARFPYALDLEHREVFYSKRCDAFWIRHDNRADEPIMAMKLAAVAAYNERIKDAVLLAYAKRELEELGLLCFLRP